MHRTAGGSAGGAALTAGLAAGAAAGLGIGLATVRRRQLTHWLGQPSVDGTPSRWRFVTINRPPEEVAPDGRIPDPIARLADELGTVVEVKVRPAPRDRGTELGVRLPSAAEPAGVASVTTRIAGSDPRQRVRAALREAKSVVETGEVLRPTSPPTTKPSLPGRLIDLATRRARGEGVL